MEQFKAHEHNPKGDAEAIVNEWEQLKEVQYSRESSLAPFHEQADSFGEYDIAARAEEAEEAKKKKEERLIGGPPENTD